MAPYDFSAGLPDTTGMGRAEKLDVLRQYRRWKEETPATYDFSAGPPDTSGLEGSERLSVLRSYRQWKEDGQAMSPAVPELMQILRHAMHNNEANKEKEKNEHFWC